MIDWFPFVSRHRLILAERNTAILSEAVARLEAVLCEQTKLLETTQRQYHELVNRTMDMKRIGFDRAPDLDYTAARPEPEEPLPELVVDAIAERAEAGTPLYRQLQAWGSRQIRLRGEEADHDEICQEILRGGTWE